MLLSGSIRKNILARLYELIYIYKSGLTVRRGLGDVSRVFPSQL